jgi:hypothetical protein
VQPAHLVTERGDLADALVAERKRIRRRQQTARIGQIDVAARHRQRANQRIVTALQLRLRDVAPLDASSLDQRELFHAPTVRTHR